MIERTSPTPLIPNPLDRQAVTSFQGPFPVQPRRRLAAVAPDWESADTACQIQECWLARRNHRTAPEMQMGPALLPAPYRRANLRPVSGCACVSACVHRSPQPTAVMRWSSTSRAIAPKVHSHRDARRIGSRLARGRTLARLCRFFRLSSPVPPCGFPIPATLVRQLTPAPVPSGGWLGSGGASPSRLAVPRAARSFCLRTLSLAGCAPGRCRFRAFVPLHLGLAALALLSARSSQAAFEPAGSRAPLAASSVRWAKSEDFTKRVFRRCCGHRSHPDRVEILCSLSGG